MKVWMLLMSLVVSSWLHAEAKLTVETDDREGVRWLYFVLDNSSDVYGYDLELAFDTQAIRIVDLNSKQTGVQVQTGDYFSSNAYEIANRVNESAGTVRLASSLLNPAPAASGQGAIAIVGVQHKKAGAATLEIKRIQLGNAEGVMLPVSSPKIVSVLPAQSKSTGAALDASAQAAQYRQAGAQSGISEWMLYAIVALLLVIVILMLALLLKRKPQAA